MLPCLAAAVCAFLCSVLGQGERGEEERGRGGGGRGFRG
jgi:hypothetical protein